VIPLPLPARLLPGLELLRGRIIRIELRHTPFALQLTLCGGGLHPAFGPPDATIRAGLEDYLALALRREDPDTLFFSRKLVIEGDTELALSIKNALDSAFG